MQTNDSLSDLIARLKNGYAVRAETITVPWSRVKEAVVAVLKQSRYVGDYSKQDQNLVITLKYDGKAPAVVDIRRVSKPGVRIYSGARELNRLTRGIGIGILSTPKGIMSHLEAKKLNVGGEIICKVW